jgi:dTDP-glucose 4,6-dehydratase
VINNVVGTANLLDRASFWKDNYDSRRFYHISTDEVYGTLGESGAFTEETAYDPHSPYSASKASADHFVRAYYDTYVCRLLSPTVPIITAHFIFPKS